MAHRVGGIEEEALGHHETGRRPIRQQRLRKWVRALDLPQELATTWWRSAIEERVGALLKDGGMEDEGRAHILWLISRSWPSPMEAAPPREKRRAAASSG
jgi:hypothetical protein